jgi:hypothetical protein
MAYEDFGLSYEPQRRAAREQRDATMAQNAYSRFLSQQRGTRDFATIERQGSRGLENLGSTLARRGLRNSGIRQQASGDYAQNWMNQRNDLLDALRQQLAQFDLQDAQAMSGYNATIGEIELQKQRDILATAAALRGMAPYLGGQ